MWYSARLLYESVLDAEAKATNGEVLFEEKLLVFCCEEDDDIVTRIKSMAIEAEEKYLSIAGNEVRWLFREILEVQRIDSHEIEDGTEVYFRFWHAPDDRDFEIMRHTHEDPWWLDSTEQGREGVG